MFKHRRRSAHGYLSSPQTPTISSPTNFVRLSGMGSVREGSLARSPVNSPVTAAPTNADAGNDEMTGDSGAVGEPLVHDFGQLHQEYQVGTLQEAAAHAPPTKAPTPLRPLSSHPVASVDEDSIAPPPPDFTRRGIHIPTRTR